MSDRVQKVQGMLSLEKQILEISPNWAPLVISSDLFGDGEIDYCDRMPTEWLTEREKTNPGRVAYDLKVMENNFVWTPGKKLNSCTAKKYDYVISSHVVEHVPDLLGHFIEVASVLKPDGEYVLVIPNGRGTGEYFRRLSEESDVVEHFFRGGDCTSPGQNWDYLRKIIKFDGTPMSTQDFEAFVRHHTDAEAIQDSLRCLKEYVDVHCWVFNRESFLKLMSSLGALRLMPFKVTQFVNSSHLTADGEPVEFIISLKKIDYEIPANWLEYIDSKPKFNWFDSTAVTSDKLNESAFVTGIEHQDPETEIALLKSELMGVSNELLTVLQSKSWSLTRPLRTLRKNLAHRAN
jgi:SAM-dependent methyltransferase